MALIQHVIMMTRMGDFEESIQDHESSIDLDSGESTYERALVQSEVLEKLITTVKNLH